MNKDLWRILGIATSLTWTAACGKAEKDKPEDEPFVSVGGGDGNGASAGQFFAFSLTTLYDALAKAASGSSLTIGVQESAAGFQLADEQSSKYPRCSGNGEPWDMTTNRVMSPSARDYPQLAFYCQFNSNDTDRTIRGTLERNKKVLCDLERIAGGPHYTAEGTVYDQVEFDPTVACGWRTDEIAALKLRSLKAKLTATSMTTGAWPQRLKIEVPGFYNVTLLFRIDGSVLSVKELETWAQDDYGRENEYVPGNATGVSGHVVTMDLSSGTIQAEIGDTYWGLRARLSGQGTLDPSTGYLKDLKATQGVVARFNKAGPEGASYLDALVAGVATDKDARAVYTTGLYLCQTGTACDVNETNFETDLQFTAGVRTCVAGSGTCDATTGVAWKKEARVLSFLKIGGSWDDQEGSRGVFEDWIVKTQKLTLNDDVFGSISE